MLHKYDEAMLLSIFEGVPRASVSREALNVGINIVDFLAVNTEIFPSKGEARKMVQGNGVSINKDKVDLNKTINADDLLRDKYILVQKGKKNYFLVIAE